MKTVVDYIPLAKKIAGKNSHFYKSNADYDDYVSAGMAGLVEASKKEPNWSKSAGTIIQNSIFDAKRKNDAMPKYLRRFKIKCDIGKKKLVLKLNREPTSKELSTELGMTTDRLKKLEKRAGSPLLGKRTDDMSDLVTDDATDQLKHCMISELIKKLKVSFYVLDRRQKQILSMYYADGMYQYEIADHLGISEPRVNQIKQKAISKLRELVCEVQV